MEQATAIASGLDAMAFAVLAAWLGTARSALPYRRWLAASLAAIAALLAALWIRRWTGATGPPLGLVLVLFAFSGFALHQYVSVLLEGRRRWRAVAGLAVAVPVLLLGVLGAWTTDDAEGGQVWAIAALLLGWIGCVAGASAQLWGGDEVHGRRPAQPAAVARRGVRGARRHARGGVRAVGH
jgi:hypothetical protein